MALNKLSEKLDHISEQDLGFDFDDSAVWSKLEQRLDDRKAFAWWWFAAACLIAGFILLPLVLQNNTDFVQKPISIKTDVPQVETLDADKVIASESAEQIKEPANTQQIITFNPPERRGIESIQVAEVGSISLSLEPIRIQKREIKKSLFTAEDISTIRASLERPTVEEGRTMTIRAQWQPSPDELNVKYQALKIKLYEKEKKQ